MKRGKRPLRMPHTLENDTVETPGPLPTPCRTWKWSSNGKYGHMYLRGRWVGAHVFFYEQANGPVPTGLEIDHLCHVRLCCEPGHLEAVKADKNVQRSRAATMDWRQVVVVREYYQRCRERGRQFPQRAVAKALGVADCTLWQMRTGNSWKSVALHSIKKGA